MDSFKGCTHLKVSDRSEKRKYYNYKNKIIPT